MPNKAFTYSVFIIVLSVFLSLDTQAQCAMCKAVVESASEDNPSTAGGINKGILYIMFIPYALLATLFYVFFRKKIKGFLKEMGLFSR